MPSDALAALSTWTPAPAGVVVHLQCGPNVLEHLGELLTGNGGEIRRVVLHLRRAELPPPSISALVRQGRVNLQVQSVRPLADGAPTEHLLLADGAATPVNYVRRLREHAWRIGRACAVTSAGSDAGPASYPRAHRRNPPNLDEPLDEHFQQAGTGVRVQAEMDGAAALLLNIGAVNRLWAAGRWPTMDLLEGMRTLHAHHGIESWIGLDAYLPRRLDTNGGGESFRDLIDRPAAIQTCLAKVDRLRVGWRGRRRVLMVTHAKGGGIERHIGELSILLRSEDILPMRAVYRQQDGSLSFTVDDGPELSDSRVRLSLDSLEAFAAALKDLRVSHVHLHSLVELPLEHHATVTSALDRLSLGFDYTWHDYSPFCRNFHLAAPTGTYCGYGETGACSRCGPEEATGSAEPDIAAVRLAFATTLSRADRVFAPDRDVVQRIRARLPELRQVVLRPHLSNLQVRRPLTNGSGPERVVGVLGGIGWNKGYHLLTSLAADAERRGLPLRFRIYGFTHPRDIEDLSNVEVLGRYNGDDDADRLIEAQPCDCFLFPSLAPETYCYTLDIAFRNAIPPVCFDIGAVANRVREAQFGAVLPLELSRTPARVNDTLVAMSLAMGDHPAIPKNPFWASAAAYYGQPAWLN